MITAVQPLFRTLIDIIFLRKGPEAIPYSSVLTAVIVGFWLITNFLVSYMLRDDNQSSFVRGLLIALIAIAAYAFVLLIMKKGGRMMQTFSALLGCGALISLTAALAVVLLSGLIGEAWAALLAIVIIFWSVPVEGHIIARAIDRHWFEGIAIAAAVFVLQLYIEFTFMPTR